MSASCIKELLKGGTCKATAMPDTKGGAYCRTHDPDRLAQREPTREELAKLREQVVTEARALREVVERTHALRDSLKHSEVLAQALLESKRPDFDPTRVQALTELAKELRLSEGKRDEAAKDDGLVVRNVYYGRVKVGLRAAVARAEDLEADAP